MILLPVQKLNAGMITAQSIYNSRGVSFLTKGTPITTQYISRLKKLGIKSLNVTSLDPSIGLPPPEDIVQEKTRVTAIHRVQDAFDDIAHNNRLNLKPLEAISETILFDLFKSRDNLAQLTDIRLHDSYTFAHCVNVAILAAMIGSYCHFTKKNLIELVLGSLLHDIGKIAVPTEILNKPGGLSNQEFTLVKQHPEAGSKKLKELSVFDSSIPILLVAQHHEHMDGTGYPNGLVGEAIHKFSRIVAIADVYDALTSDRAYKKAYKPHIAYKIMTKCSPGQFDTELLDLFFNNVAVYPVGTIIQTKYGYAIVKEAHYGRTQTPLICLFADSGMKLLSEPYLIDTKDCTENIIEQVMEDKDLMPLLFRLRIDPAIYLKN